MIEKLNNMKVVDENGDDVEGGEDDKEANGEESKEEASEEKGKYLN